MTEASCKAILVRLPLLAQAFLREFVSRKLHLEDDDDLTPSFERQSTAALDKSHPAAKPDSNFDGNTRIITLSTVEPQRVIKSNNSLFMPDLYRCLSEEKESRAVKAVLKNLRKCDVLDSAMMEELVLDKGQRRKKPIDPVITTDTGHMQVKR